MSEVIERPVCVECVMTWLLFGDGGFCLFCRAYVYSLGKEGAEQ